MAKEVVLGGLRSLLSMRTFVVHPHLLTLLATEGLATAKPGFLDRLIHAEADAAGLPLITFEKAAARLPNTEVLE
jgi:predicted nucleic-acid-binding protein